MEMALQFMFFFVMAAVKDFSTKGSNATAAVQKTASGLQAGSFIYFIYLSEALTSRGGGVHRHNLHERTGSAHSACDVDLHRSHTF